MCEYICSALGDVANLFYEFIEVFVHFLNVGFKERDLIICICDYKFYDHVEYGNFLLSGGWGCQKGWAWLCLFVCFVVSVSHFFGHDPAEVGYSQFWWLSSNFWWLESHP